MAPRARIVHRKRRYLGVMSFRAQLLGSVNTLSPHPQLASQLEDPRDDLIQAKSGRIEDHGVRGRLERRGRALGVLAVASVHRLPDAVELRLASGLVRPPARPLFGLGREVYLQVRSGQDDRSDVPALDYRSPLLAGPLRSVPLHVEKN